MARRRVTTQPGDQVGGPIAIVQILQRNWTKAARGAPLAAQRRRLPEALPLPQVLPSEPPPRYLIQHAEFDLTAPLGEPSRLAVRQETPGIRVVSIISRSDRCSGRSRSICAGPGVRRGAGRGMASSPCDREPGVASSTTIVAAAMTPGPMPIT